MFMTSERGGVVDQRIEIEKDINPLAETLKYNVLDSQQIHHVLVPCLVWEAARDCGFFSFGTRVVGWQWIVDINRGGPNKRSTVWEGNSERGEG